MERSKTRFLIPLVALCVLLVGAEAAFGQGATLTLGSNPTRVRAEGITETVGLITLTNNTSGPQAIGSTVAGQGVTMIVAFNATITNGDGAGAGTCSVSDINTGAVGTGNVFTTGAGSQAAATALVACVRSGSNLTITIPAATANATTAPCTTPGLCIATGGSLNIAGVRLNASAVGAGVNLTATVTTTPTNALTFPGGSNETIVGRPQVTLGSATLTRFTAPILGGAGVAMTTSAVAGTIPVPIFQCTFPATPAIVAAGNAQATVAAAPGIAVTLAEPTNFAQAFTSVADETGFTTALQQGTPPVNYGVQFNVNFAGLPAGTTLWAPQLIAGTPATPSAGLTLALVTAQGAGAAAPALAANGGLVNAFAPTGAGDVTVTYQVTASVLTVAESITIPFWVTAAAGTVVPVATFGTSTVQIGRISSVTTFSTTNPTVRFITNSTSISGTEFTVAACVTNILFPFVSNKAGTTFNAGVALSNTAADGLGTVGQTGGVIIRYFGTNEPAGGRAGIAMPITAVSAGGTATTAGVLAPGEYAVVLLSAVAPGFEGYLVVTCNFQFAHGFALVIDQFGVGAPYVSLAYLPLILNGALAARVAGPPPLAEALGN